MPPPQSPTNTIDPAEWGSPNNDIASAAYNWPAPPRSGPTGQLLPWLDWKYSLLLPVALLLVLATALWQVTNRPVLVEFAVYNSSSGEAIPGAHVAVNNLVYETREDGVVTLGRPDSATAIRVSADGFISMSGELSGKTAASQQISLRPSTLIGRVTDVDTGDPVAGADVSVLRSDGSVVSSTRTDDAGAYRLTDVPEGATVRLDAGVYGTHTQDIGTSTELSFPLAVQTASGLVLDDSGDPLQGAVVRSGDATAISAGDGTYLLEGVVNEDEVTITAPGFESTSAVVSNGEVDGAQLAPQMVKAVYANIDLLTTDGGLDSLIEIANTTEINAIVIDVKEGAVFYDSEVQFFEDAGTIRPFYDLANILDQLEENDIYTIARVVVFQDPLVAQARPDLAVQDTNGGLWLNVQDIAWVNAFHEELWDANIELSVELVERGFDEIQYDYVRFPSDGDLTTAEFGREYTSEAREAAITEFMKRSHEAINAAGGFLAADLFGFVTIVDDEQYIGQRFSALEPHLDFVCMMIYPSHFETGNIASAPGHPNDYPYETILESLQRAEQIVHGSGAKFRPWLQDFSYYFNDLRDYTPADVRAQIDAAEEFGASGWMLWGDPFNVTVEALNPEPGD